MTSKRHVRRHQCGRKRKHATAAHAAIEVERARKRGVRLTVYKCPWCHHYHAGHN